MMNVDRLSELPDCLIIHILSFLDIQTAAKTCVLSKRWQFLWTEFKRLQFYTCDYGFCDEKTIFFPTLIRTRTLASFISRALARHSGNHLETFEVSLMNDEHLASHIDGWIDFLTEKRVKNVSLFLVNIGQGGGVYTLSEMIYSNSSLTSLSLETCNLDPKGTIVWSSLATLYLDRVTIPQHVLDKILTECPALVSLSLLRCREFKCLVIRSHRVRTLRVMGTRDSREAGLEISAPYVHLLDISVYREGRKLRLRNISSDVTAKFEFSEQGWDHRLEAQSYMKGLFVSLQHIKNLELGTGAILVLEMLAARGWQFPQSVQRKSLTIKARRDGSISAILSLLESSPFLETLVIEDPIGFRVPTAPASGDLDCDLLHLKTVSIINFIIKGGFPMLKLAQILLKRAVGLEKMVIKEDNIFSSWDSNMIALTLHSYPKSSQKAEVILRDGPLSRYL